MRKFIHKAVHCLLRPLQGGGSFFLFTYALLLLVLLPVWWLTAAGAKVNGWTFVEAYADCYLLALSLSFLPARLRHVFQGICVGGLLVCSVVDFFVKVNFQTFINSAMLRLAMETRGNEVSQFLSSYVMQLSSAFVVLPFLLWGAAWLFYVRRVAGKLWHGSSYLRKGIVGVVLICLLVGGIGSFPVKIHTFNVLRSKTVSDLEVTYGDAEVLSLYSPAHRLLFSLRGIQLVNRQVVNVRQVHRDMVVAQEENKVPKVVLVIGESFNRTHSQLYGYALPTTPLQVKRAERGELIYFTDAVSCWNLTSYVFQNLFSLHSVDSPAPWENYPLFPAIYKKAGYQVSFLSNQFPTYVAGSISAFSGSFFLNDPVLSRQMFDYHSPTIITPVDDANLLQEYDNLKIDSLYELTIFSLVGMHFNYDVRIPSDDWKYFEEGQYLSKGLATADRQIIADYDNAVRYNDSILESILQRFEDENAIVIYCPDHGEELFDGSGVWGRTYPEVLSDAEMHNQFEVPLWVWCSSRFRTAHPDKVERLEAARNLPFMTDDLPHLLLQLTGISCDALDPTRSPLSDTYNMHRKRILRGWQEYKW